VPERALAVGAEVVQIFSSNPRTWRARSAGPDEMAALVAGLRRHRLPLFFHTVYLINLASPDESLRQRSAESLAHALATGAQAGAAGVVTHIGSHKGEGFDRVPGRVVAAVRTAEARARALLTALGQAPALPPLLLETGAGTGAVVGGRLEELAVLVEALGSQASPWESAALQPTSASSPEVGLCLDTAHLFAAGYPIHDTAGLDEVIHELREAALLNKVGLVHLNDSAGAFASNRDRHANPGEGLIGYEGLARVVRHPALTHVPFVLETPGADGHGPDLPNVALVKSMRAGAPAPPRGPARAAAGPAE